VIDLHCHILPALDDGAIDLEDSVTMAREAEADGIDVVCATPHIHPDHEIRIADLEGRVAALNEELERQGVGVRIETGGEIAEPIVDDLDDDDLRCVSLGRNGCWLLIEPKPGPLDRSLVETVERLERRGFHSVIAHPERHPGAGFRDLLVALVERGALIQATAALVADGPAAPTLLDLAGEGLIHLLGSDAHSSHGGRPVRLSEGIARLSHVERIRPHAHWVTTEGPQAILRAEAARAPFAPVDPDPKNG
jgi:protein-tyrosine phosphatase